MEYHKQAHRAKLFIPFDALKGFREALAEKEQMVVPRRELSEDFKEELDRKFRQIRLYDGVTVVYYDRTDYKKLTGAVSKIDETRRVIRIADREIPAEDIVELYPFSVF